MNKIEKRCLTCQKKFEVSNYRRTTAQYCGFKCYWTRMKGTDNLAPYRRTGPLPQSTRIKMSLSRTKTHEGQTKTLTTGYVMRRLKDHPNRDIHDYYAEHRYVMEKAIGRLLKTEEIVHHINHKRGDNRIENLMLFKSARGHQLIHKGSVVPAGEILFAPMQREVA